MLVFYEKNKVACNMAFHCVGKNKKKRQCMFFSQYPEAGIIIMCFLLHVKLGGDNCRFLFSI